jgi:beta-glucosidase/6-phospho-beta-glucosidase/beta-galactosidase
MGGGRKAYYQVAHNLLLAHAAAVKSYRTWHAPQQKGKIGLTTNVVWAEPLTDSFEGARASEGQAVGA